MTLEHSTINGVLVLVLLESRLDAINAQAVREDLLQAVDQGHSHVALDISHLAFIDSSGIAVLLAAFKVMRERGELVLFGMREKISKIFRITKLDRGVFRIFPDKDAAMAAINPTNA